MAGIVGRTTVRAEAVRHMNRLLTHDPIPKAEI
jgi:hypothetical protein